MRNDFFKVAGSKKLLEVAVNGEGCLKEAIPGVEKLEVKSEDASTEKHVPYVEEQENGYLVKVGKETAHPMQDAHYIQFIEIVVDDNNLYRRYLNPGDAPEAFFAVPKGTKVVAREYCNLHGVWQYTK